MVETPLQPDYYTTKRAARFLGGRAGGPHEKTLMRWRAQGKGPKYLMVGGRVRYRLQDLESYIESCVVDPAAAATARNKRARRQQSASFRTASARKPAA